MSGFTVTGSRDPRSPADRSDPSMSVGIVVPTYNEADNLPVLVARLAALNLDAWEVIVVDDASPDGTGRVAEALVRQYPGRVVVVHQPRRMGLGSAYRAGFRRALRDGVSWVVQMDADLSHAPEDLPRLLEEARRADVVVGSRYVPGGSTDPRWGRGRRWLSRFGNLYARWVTGLQVRDATAGFKVFRREVLERIGIEDLRSDGYAFQVEVALRCQRLGVRVTEVPIHFRARVAGRSKLGLRQVGEAVWRLWTFRLWVGRGGRR